MADYPTIGYEGSVTSWAGTANALLLSKSSQYEATLNVDGGITDRTEFAAGSTVPFKSFGVGLRSWSGSIRARILLGGLPPSGYLGAITYASGYTLFPQGWDMTIACAPTDITGLGTAATVAGWKQSRPTQIEWSGSYNTLVGNTTALTAALPPAPNTAAAAATFTLSSTAPTNFSGTIHHGPTGLHIPVADKNTLNFGFQGSSTLTAAGLENVIAAGAVAVPTWDTTGDGIADCDLVFTTSTGRTVTGPAFWTALKFTVTPAEYLLFDIDFQGAGALTPT